MPLTNYQEFGYIDVSWSNGQKDSAWYSWRVYRRDAVPVGAWELIHETKVDQSVYHFHDWTAKVGWVYQYAVVQVAYRFDQPVESNYPASAQVTPFDDAYWLINPDDETMNMRLHVRSDQFKDEVEEATINLIGRGRRKEFGTIWGKRGSVTASIRRDSTLTPAQQRARLEDLRLSLKYCYFRNPFGDVWKVTTGDIDMSRIAGVGNEEMIDVSFEYEEVI